MINSAFLGGQILSNKKIEIPNTHSRQRTGALLTLLAGTLWGFSGCCGQYIFDNFSAQPHYLTAYRMLFAGALMILFGLVVDRKNMVAIWADKTYIPRLFAFAIIGVMFNSLSYLTAISHSNSGTATILQYLGPLLIMIVTCFTSRKLPSTKEATAIILALLGTFILATHGDIHTMVITPLGLTWGLLAAVGLATYTMIPVPVIAKYGSIATTGYGMFIGGGVLFIMTKSWEAPMIPEPSCIAAFFAMVVVGTVITYTIYMAGVNRCGVVKASMLSTIEPVSATVIMVIWLKETFAFMDFIGFICIFITVFMLMKKEE